MTRYKCLSCMGTYDPDQPGGYYHTCPPLTLPDGSIKERIDKRDENIDDSVPDKPCMKMEGKGREPLPEPEGSA